MRIGSAFALALVLSLAAAPAASGSQPAVRTSVIPLRGGLTLVEAGPGKLGDYEAIYHIEAVGGGGVAVSMSIGSYEFAVRRFVRRIDLEYAHRCMCSWSSGQPRIFAGTTAFGTSASVLRDLQTRGSTLFVDMWQQPAEIPPHRLQTKQEAGMLVRATSNRQTMAVLLNDRIVQLPVIHAAGDFGDVRANFFWLDDLNNPLLIHGDIGGGGGRLVKIYLPGFDPGGPLEQALRRNQAVTLYGIFFDPGRATLRAESQPALTALVAVLRRHPSWRLRLAVHTDNLGGWDGNLVLAKKRAIALARALAQRDTFASKQLEIMGAGAADAVASNLTTAGRALNRRVVVSRS